MSPTKARSLTLAALALAAALTALIGASARAAGSPCARSSLAFRQGALIVAKTQQLPILLEIVNVGRSACTLDGYPRVALLSSSGAAYPFAYHDGGDTEITYRRPQPVTLRAGGRAFALINKTACVANAAGRLARHVRLTAPGGGRELPPITLRGFYFDYCGPGDPGHRVDVSPVESNPQATMHR